MPELPDIETYLHALEPLVRGRRLTRVRLAKPFLLRSVEPPLAALENLTLLELSRLGKRIVFAFEENLFAILHLMVAGRLAWKPDAETLTGRSALAAFDFDSGSLIVTEAGSKRRASLYLVRGRQELAQHDPGGLEVLEASLGQFTRTLKAANHTLKRSLTDPRIISGVGNAFSDEILHRARLSPFKRSRGLDANELERLYTATRSVLAEWTKRLIEQSGKNTRALPKLTAFRPEMAVHGKYGNACPDCEAPIQRILYATNEANYCPRCQTGGRILADRVLSQLLKDDWPRTLEELEERHL